MDIKIIAAIIAASVALLTSILSLVASYVNNRRQQKVTEELQDKAEDAAQQLEVLRSRLQRERDEDSSRRTYILEGKKRLYEEYEPIRFQLAEAALHAAWRVQSIARSARQNDIRRDGSGWLSAPREYYTMVVIYDLMLPAVWYRIMKRKLTFVDFSLDNRIEWEYILAKSYYFGFTNDFWLAKVPGFELEYDPLNENWHQLRKKNPAVYWRQGIPVSMLDAFLESLTIQTESGLEPMTFGKLQTRIDKPNNDDELLKLYDVIADNIVSFHPKTRPVLWRVLLYEVVVAHAYFLSWRQSRQRLEENIEYSIPALDHSLIEKYRVDVDTDPAHELEVVLKRAQEDVHNAFSL